MAAAVQSSNKKNLGLRTEKTAAHSVNCDVTNWLKQQQFTANLLFLLQKEKETYLGGSLPPLPILTE